MSRSANCVILCEDRQHEAFARRFLELTGQNHRIQRVEISPKGRGSGEQYVRERFAKELAYYRSRQHRVEQALVVVLDADGHDIEARIAQIENAAIERGQQKRKDHERVAIFIPSRNIETWLAYLEGQTINETDNYPRLSRERECRWHAEQLNTMCQQKRLREPVPPSLKRACAEYSARLKQA